MRIIKISKNIVIVIVSFMMLLSCKKDNDVSVNGTLNGKYTIIEGTMLHERFTAYIEIKGNKIGGFITAPLLGLNGTSIEGEVIKEVNQYGVTKGYELHFNAISSNYSFEVSISELEIDSKKLYMGKILESEEYCGNFYTISEGIDTIPVIDYKHLPINPVIDYPHFDVNPCKDIDKIGDKYYFLNYADTLFIYDESWALLEVKKLQSFSPIIDIEHDESNIWIASTSRIYRYNLNMELQDSINIDGGVRIFAIYDNSIWIQKGATTELIKMSYDGVVISTLTSPAKYPLQAVFTADNIFLLDGQYPRAIINKINYSGELLNKYYTQAVIYTTEGALSLIEDELWFVSTTGLQFTLKP